MKNFLLVFAGGGLGSALRYFTGRWVSQYYTQVFPVATLVSNVAACFVLGLVIGYADQKQLLSASARLFWTVGFCGGFSTFSTFSQESLTLLYDGQQLVSMAYIGLSVLLCVGAVFAGQFIAKL